MTQWNRFLFLSLFFSFLSLQTFANEVPCWDICGEFLYLKPGVSNSYYTIPVVTSPLSPNYQRKNNSLDFKPAYRLSLSYELGLHNEVYFAWTHLPKFNSSKSFGRRAQIPTQGSPPFIGTLVYATATSDIDLTYFAADGFFGFWKTHNPCFNCKVLGGVHFAKVIFKENIHYQSPTNSAHVENKSNVSGIGPEFEIDCNYAFNPLFLRGCGSLNFVSAFKAGLLASRYLSHYQFIQIGAQPGTTNALNDTRWDLTPFIDCKIGINYGRTFRCFHALIEIGYEMMNYRNFVNRISFLDTLAAGRSIDVYSDATFQGPYISLNVLF